MKVAHESHSRDRGPKFRLDPAPPAISVLSRGRRADGSLGSRTVADDRARQV